MSKKLAEKLEKLLPQYGHCETKHCNSFECYGHEVRVYNEQEVRALVAALLEKK